MLVRQSQLTPSRLLHNRTYTTLSSLSYDNRNVRILHNRNVPGCGFTMPWKSGLFFSEWYLIAGTAFSLMALPLVIQYRVKARKLAICPSQRIYVQASRPCLNKVPFQLVQLFSNHKTNSYAMIALYCRPRRKHLGASISGFIASLFSANCVS